MPALSNRRFAIALSFPGEHRRFVRNVANRLAELLGCDRVFFDEWYEGELVGVDGDLKLTRYYRDQSEMVVPFFSEHYDKPWCGIEWRATRAMLHERWKEDAVVPVQMDGTRIEGWEKIDFAIRRKNRPGWRIADLILEAYRHRHWEEASPSDGPSGGGNVSSRTTPPPPAPGFTPRWSNELPTYGEGFAGRGEELSALSEAWDSGRTRVFALHAEGGAGKTRVLVKWLTDLRDAGWRGAGGVFVHSFYSEGNQHHRNASSEVFFDQALTYFGYDGDPITDPATKGRTLAQLVVEHRGLLVLDGIEPLQHPPTFNQGRLKDPAIEHLLLSLSAATSGEPSPAMCVITSRQPATELRDREGRSVVQRHLDRLDPEAGAELLRKLDVQGTDPELPSAVDDFRGHAYSLMLLGSYLRDATDDRDVRRRHQIPLLEEDEEYRFHARHMFSAYVAHLGEDSPEVAVLHLLGFFDRPAERELLDVLCEKRDDGLDAITAALSDLSRSRWNRILNRLRDLRLIAFDPGGPAIDGHPLLREYFAHRLRSASPGAWTAGHRRLYEHLCETTEHRPDTLAGLQPLYQAVAHGCRAGLHEEALNDVYRERILRDGEFYSTKKLGAIGADLAAVACFFEAPWRCLSPTLSEEAQAWLLHEAGFRLRLLGRLSEAVDPMRATAKIATDHEDWGIAAIRTGNLSDLERTLGKIAVAVRAAEQAVTFADRTGDTFQRLARRTQHADALHQAGRQNHARHLFAQAEAQTS